MVQLTFDRTYPGVTPAFIPEVIFGNDLKNLIVEANPVLSGLSFYLIQNGRIVESNDTLCDGSVHVVPRLVGGKGGFGSMLRAIGAQIEKTTNREACRDLSGRRLRDINEEKRLKKWISEQSEREQEETEKKKKKIQKLCSEPKHEFSDAEYDKTRSEMTDKVYEAVEQGLKAVTEESKTCDNVEQVKKAKKRPKGAMWLDMDEIGSEDSDLEDEAEESSPKKSKVELVV